MEFLPEKIDKYVEEHTTPESPLLQKLNRETWAKILMPRMLSGHVQGRILSTFSHMIRPQNVLEIGTYTGYSAICLAEGMKETGQLISLDINEELEEWVKEYWDEAGLKNAKMMIGDATTIIPTLELSWDLVFIDADKENYSTYFDLVIDQVNPGGFIIADNVLWSGKVVEGPGKNDKETPALQAFNQKVHDDPRIENVLFPVRDGLMVMRKR